jgi:signal transduction histidine kinase
MAVMEEQLSGMLAASQIGGDGPPQAAAERSARAVENFTALGQIAGGVAHDFRNILCIIASGLRVAERNTADPVKRRAALAAAHNGVERGLRMVTRLLAFPTLPAATDGSQDLNALLRQLEAFLKYGAGAGNRIILQLADDLPCCRVDPVQFNAAILNLVLNSRDALRERGTICIRTHAAERDLPTGGQRDFVQVQVRDNGVGMPSNVLDRIFDPYFTTKGDSGTGLGVPQVKALLDKLGGALEVVSAPGEGTTFDLFFPTSVEQVAAPEAWRPVDQWANEGGAIAIPVHLPKPAIPSPSRER